MRFYLDVPLVVGYVLMATTACFGMLQYAAARGGYSGLSLFVADRKQGKCIGAALTIGAVLAYVLFAPEILTPGPAGSEVAATFSICALVALLITLLGTDLRIRRVKSSWPTGDGERLLLDDLSATLYRPPPSPANPPRRGMARAPAVLLLPDPSGLFATPRAVVEGLCKVGIAVLILDAKSLAKSGAPLSRKTILAHTSTALSHLERQPGIDGDRIGLLGLGLGSHVTLQVAASDAQIKGAIAVSPVLLAPLKPGITKPGLDWLHELSYRQVWRWRRRWPALQRTAVELGPSEQLKKGLPAAKNGRQENDYIMAIRRNARVVERLSVPGQQYFTLLENKQARRVIVQWFQDNLQHA